MQTPSLRRALLAPPPRLFARRIAHLPLLTLPTNSLPGQGPPKIWINDRFNAFDSVYSDDYSLAFEPSVENLHRLIYDCNFASAYRVLCALQNQGKDIPHDMIFLDAALAQVNTLSSATHNAFYGWLNLVPARHHPNGLRVGKNPFRLFNKTLFCSGSPSTDLEVILGMVKIASSKGYFFEEFRQVVPLMTRLVKPQSGLALILELEQSHLDYVKSVWPHHVERHACLVRRELIMACCEAKGRWLRVAVRLLKLSKQEGILVPPGLADLVKSLKRHQKGT
ncbi:hypothetical protein D9757_005849 [Collybiopsis confluens]|uniref:Uncharacterized protein n=1 Tax=Collybiopsis confluens TaxID=2823264 RepID=A0A8H5MA59_9AGAR|nr:hypothetical protein D9757_005849 [Collybiopsis confluens]